MQKLFNKHKRKHHESPSFEERSSNRKKQKDSHEDESFFARPYGNPSLDIPLRTNSLDQGRKGQKIVNLIRALNDALDEDGMDETAQLIGDDNISRCLDLRTALKGKKLDIDTAPISPPASQPNRLSMSMSHDYQNIPKTISPLSLTPWKSSIISTTLPPAPKILDPTLEASAFTHLGCGAGRPSDLNYERLEWIGDAYLQLISTLLIAQTFPSLMPGKFSHLREMIVKNATLAGYSLKYGFDKRAVLPEHMSQAPQHEKMKIMGDIFEAYVAAAILSDPENGVIRVSEWLKELWGMTLAKDIIQEERNGEKVDSPLWRLRGHAEPVQPINSTVNVTLNPKEQLQKMLGSKGVKLHYRDAAPEKKSKETKLPIFTVAVHLEGWGEKDKMLGSGKAGSKKEAGFKAAEMALGNKKLMKVYTDKKKIFDAQMELERQALEQQQEGK